MIGTAQTGAASVSQTRVATAASKTATTLKAKSPLPKAQAEALAKLVSNLGKKGVPLTQDKTDITDDGRFSVEFTINKAALPAAARTAEALKRCHDFFREELRTTSVWKQPMPGKLRVVTGQSFEYLKGCSEPSSEFLERLGVSKTSLSPMDLRIIAAVEKRDQEG